MAEKNKNYQTMISDIPLMEYNNIFTGNLVWIERGVDKAIATYDLVVREIPKNWGFYMFSGIERFIDILLNYKFDKDAIKILKGMGFIDSKKSENFYKKFKFSGDVWALTDGTIFFPGEPIVRVTAPLLEANLLTAFLLNCFNYPIKILTKNMRYKLSLGKKVYISGGMVRLSSFEQGVWCSQTAFLLGSPEATPFLFRKFPDKTPQSKGIIANLNHAVIKSFPTEKEAFRYVLDKLAPKINICSVMVDTYDFESGLDKFIEEVKKTKDFDPKKFLICIDSGDLEKNAIYTRKVLDENGLKSIGINAMGNLDEYKINSMVKRNIPIDIPIPVTELVNITDNPKLEVVYKMTELIHEDGTVEYKAKLTPGKESFPCKKQIFRVYDKNGLMEKDIIGLDLESLGEPLLNQFIKKGKLVMKMPTLNDIKKHIEDDMRTLPDPYKKIKKPKKYPIEISKELCMILDDIKKAHVGKGHEDEFS